MSNRILAFHAELDKLRIPVEGVKGRGGVPVAIVFKPEATREQREQAAALLAAFDPDAPDPRDVRRARLKELAASVDEATRLLIEEVLGE